MPPTPPTALPREISPGIHWFSTCLPVRDGDRLLHNHNSCFLVIGRDRTLLIDTGMPHGWTALRQELLGVLDGRKLDYILPTHPESPHMGNAAPLLAIFPGALLVGDLRNYHLYFPNDQDRFRPMQAGETIDLGGRVIELLPAVVHDLPNTLWAYAPDSQTLFLSDAYPFTHEHDQAQCGLLAEELPIPPRPESARLVIERALSWARFVDPEPAIAALDALLAARPVRQLCPAHGGVITDPAGFASTFSDGLRAVRRSYVAG